MKQFYVVPINDAEFSLNWSPSTLNVGCMYFVTYIPTDVTGQRVQGSADLKKVRKESNAILAARGRGDGGRGHLGSGGYPIPQYRKKNWQLSKYRVKNRRNTDTSFIFGHAYLI